MSWSRGRLMLQFIHLQQGRGWMIRCCSRTMAIIHSLPQAKTFFFLNIGYQYIGRQDNGIYVGTAILCMFGIELLKIILWYRPSSSTPKLSLENRVAHRSFVYEWTLDRSSIYLKLCRLCKDFFFFEIYIGLLSMSIPSKSRVIYIRKGWRLSGCLLETGKKIKIKNKRSRQWGREDVSAWLMECLFLPSRWSARVGRMDFRSF